MKKVALLLFAVMLLAGGCELENEAPPPDSDSQQEYEDGSKIPVDDNIYTIKGTVITDVESLVRQAEPAQGSGSIVISGGFGYGSSAFVGEKESGKGFVRVVVDSVSPATELATVGHMVILKTSDTKASALAVGDIVTFKCRRQYEAIAAVREREEFDKDKVATWELDYCRLVSPDLGELPEPEPTTTP